MSLIGLWYLRQEDLSYDPEFRSVCKPTKLKDPFREIWEKAYPNATIKQAKVSRLTLDDLPTEIRDQIFKGYVAWAGDYMAGGHPMPALLIALRRHRPLNMYIQVLRLIYKQNVFCISLPLPTARKFVPRSSVSRIEQLTLSHDPYFSRHRYTVPNVPYHVSVQSILFCASSLRTLHLDHLATGAASIILSDLPNLLCALRGLKSLARVSLELSPLLLQRDPEDADPEDADYDLIDDLNGVLGSRGMPASVLTRVQTEGEDRLMELWFWAAEEGRMLGC